MQLRIVIFAALFCINMENDRNYYAFISYKREDEKWAVWLQHKLEHYKLPSNLNGRTDLPKEIRPIFRDQSELAGGVLADEIQKALESSKYLIVICSPRAAQSQWVGKEVQFFIDIGRTDKIIPFIIGGTAHAQNPEDESFPAALLNLPPEQELLGININEMGQDAAAVKVVAQMFGLKFDALWQRYEREQKRKKRIVFFGIAAFAIAALSVAGWIWRQNVRLKEKEWSLMENQSRFVAEKALELEEEDSYLARLLAVDVLPVDLDNPNRPYTNEAEYALRNASLSNSFSIKKDYFHYMMDAVYSYDGKLLVLLMDDGEIMVFDSNSGSLINSFYVKTSIRCPSFSNMDLHCDGNQKFLLLSSKSVHESKTILINLDTGEEVMTWPWHSSVVHFSFDGGRIVSCVNDSVLVLNREDGNVLHTLVGHTGYVTTASFNRDGNLILSASSDSTVKVWNSDNGELLKTLYGHTNYVLSASFSPDGNRIVSSSYGVIIVWDVETGSLIRKIDNLNSWVKHAFFYQDDETVVASTYQYVRKWDVQTGKERGTLLEKEGVSLFSLSPNSTKAVAIVNNVLRAFDVMGDEETKLVKGAENKVALFSPRGSQIFYSINNKICIWDMNKREVVKVLGDSEGFICAFAVNPDAKNVASITINDSLYIWDVETGERKREWKLENILNRVSSATYSPDGKWLLFTDGSSLSVCDAEFGIELRKILGGLAFVHPAMFSPDGKHIVTGSESPPLKIKDFYTDNTVQTMEMTYHNILSAAFSPDGNYVASASANFINVWDVKTGLEVYTFVGREPIVRVAYSPDGKYIIAGSLDKSSNILVLDSKTGNVVCTFNAKGQGGRVNSVSFSPDGKQILASFNNGMIRLWPFSPLQELIYQTRERFKNRPLTPEERRQYYLE